MQKISPRGFRNRFSFEFAALTNRKQLKSDFCLSGAPYVANLTASISSNGYW